MKLSPAAKSAGNSWELEGRVRSSVVSRMRTGKSAYSSALTRTFCIRHCKAIALYARRFLIQSAIPELRELLQQRQFTAANQIVAAMKELGF